MLERKGFKHPGTWTFEEASEMMTMLANNRWQVPAHIDPATYTPQQPQPAANPWDVSKWQFQPISW
jgi:hypothetical protein